jgi:hypothetical protein
MSTDEQTAANEAIMPGSVGKIAHGLANSYLIISVALFNFWNWISNSIRTCKESTLRYKPVKNECRRMKSRLEELRRLP